MIEYDDALAAIAALPITMKRERIALACALGRICAEDLALPADQPPFDRAAMDGFAVVLKSETTRFAVVGEVAAGSVWKRALVPGEAVRIMTGAPCPAGATVVPREVAREAAGWVECESSALVAGRHIAWRGEDARAGETVLAAGTRFTPATIALAAACGARDIAVAVPPRWTILTTGDEVGAGGDAGIADTNGPYLLALAAALGCAATRAHAGDDADDLARKLEAARRGGDIVVTTGGVSDSGKDLVPAVAAQLGFAPIFHQVAMQPGKPVLLARHSAGQLLVGLPGNPVSVMATAHLVLLPIVDRFLGARAGRWRNLPLATPCRNRGKRRLFQPARMVAGGVEALAWNGSGDFVAAAAGDGFIDLAPGADLTAGATVRFLPYVGAALGDGGQLPQRRGDHA